MTKDFAIDARLGSAAEFVRQGAVFADIGTDHAYLPLFLLARGRIARACCTDIRKGPLENARRHVLCTPFADCVHFVHTDGLRGLEAQGITDIAVCGMGGELIVSILEAAPFVRDESIRLILQPMSRPAVLRRYLLGAGFAIRAQTYSQCDGKDYICLCAHFGAAPRIPTLYEAEFGCSATLRDPAFASYFYRRRRALLRTLAGKRAGLADTSFEEQLLREMREHIAKEESHDGT